ncbi:trigger factor, partial [Pseudomonas syringae pv. tagetis]
DQLNIDFLGKVEGEVFPRDTATPTQQLKGYVRKNPGKEDGLVGAKTREESLLKVPFPQHYHIL